MAAAAGRALRIKYDADGAGGTAAVVIAGARTDSITINNTAIDITDKDDSGIVTLLDDIGTQSVALSVEGVATDSTLGNLADSAAAGAALHYFEIAVASLRTYAANFFITDFAYTGEDGDNPLTFSCTLTSSGTVTKT
jgi:TP901-1 family phage major tail protein